MKDFTQRLQASSTGDPNTAAELLPMVYQELRQLAAGRLAGESHAHTLQPTALVHDVWLKVSGSNERTWQGREHFLAAAATAMRQILVDRARRRLSAKRGFGWDPVDSDTLHLPAPAPDEQLLALNEVLTRFAGIDPRKAELVQLRYFAGFTFEEAAGVLGIAVPTAKQWWHYARAWLRVEMQRSAGNPTEKHIR